MDPLEHPEADKLLRLIGAIVLVSQDAERTLRVILPFVDAKEPSLGRALERAQRLSKQSLGSMTKKLAGAATTSSGGFKQQLEHLVACRNQVVHQFHETHGNQIMVGEYAPVLRSLQHLLDGLQRYRTALDDMLLGMLEGLRDVTFAGTAEFQQFAELCTLLRARVGGGRETQASGVVAPNFGLAVSGDQ